MGRRTKVTTIKEDLPEGTLAEGEQPAESLPENIEFTERLAQIRTSLGAGHDDITIKVYRIAPGRNPAFCFSDKSVDEEKIQQRCKSGTFECKVISGGQVIDTVTVEIDESVIPTVPQQNGNDPIVALLMQQNAQLMQAFTQMVANGNNNHAQPTMLDLVSTLKGLKDLSGGGNDTAMKMFEKGIDLATKVGGFGEKSWTTELFETIKDVAAPLVPALLAGKITPQTQQQLSADTMTQEQKDEQMMRQAIAGIKQQALANVPASLVLEWIENHASEYAAVIHRFVTSDFATIAALDPDLSTEPLSTYFKTLYDGLRQSHMESAAMDVDSSGEDGDEGDDTTNGASGANVIIEPEVIRTGGKSGKRSRN